MQGKRFAVAALIAAVSTSVVIGTANGAPADARPGSDYAAASLESMSGNDSGVDYTVSRSVEGESAIGVTVDGGRFVLNGSRLDISDDSGQLIGQVPLTLRIADRVVSFTARIADSGRAVTIASAGPAQTNIDIAQEPLTSEQRIYCWNATLGTTIGMVVGILVGFPLLMPGMLATSIIGGLVGMAVALNAPMPGMSPTDDLMTKFIRCQQGMSPYGG